MKKSISLLLAATMLCMLVSFSVSAEVIDVTYTDENGYIYLLSSDGTYYNVHRLYIPSPKIDIPEEVNGLPVKGILPEAFEDNHSITNVTIPDSVIWIGERAFYDCENLLRINLGNSVTEIGYQAFYGCENLTSITIPDSVITIHGRAFEYCTSLTNVTIGDSVTTIDSDAFAWCDSLTSVNISDLAAWCNINFGNIFSNPLYFAKYLFLDEKPVTDLVIPSSVSSIGKYAFSHCWNIKSVTIGNSVVSIGDDAFNLCWGLKSVVIPDSVTTIGEGVFYNCDDLTDIYCEAPSLPNGWNPYWLGDCEATVHWGHVIEREKDENRVDDFESIELIVMLAFVGIILTLFMVILVIIIRRINNRQKITKG